MNKKNTHNDIGDERDDLFDDAIELATIYCSIALE